MQDAVAEMSHYGEFDYLVVNDDFNTALNELKSIIMANRLQQKSQAIKLKSLIHDLLA
jgi:guanylate kinase